MIRKSHLLLALALAATALSAPIAQAQAEPPQGHVNIPSWLAHIQYPGTSSKPTVYMAGSAAIPGGLVRTQYPGTSSEPSVLIAPVADAPKPVDPLAVSYLTGRGLSPSEVASWTTGACSHQAKAASCYAMLDRTAAAVPTQVARSIGFQWGDAGIGAGFTLGAFLLIGGAGAGLLISRKNRRREVAHA